MMKKNSRVAEVFGIEYPVFQAPMSWITSAELVAAVSNAGGLGILGPNAGQTELTSDPIETAERMRAEIRKTRSLTSKPFGVEVICAGPDVKGPFDEPLLKVLEEEDVPVVMFLDDGPVEYIERMKKADKKLIKRNVFATRANIAAAENLGFDAITVCGTDCGGHSNHKTLGTFAAVRLAKEVTNLPLIIGGGVIDAKSVEALGILGAEGVWVGTRFVASVESPVAQATKDRMLQLSIDDCVQVEGGFGPVMSVPTKSINACLELMEESQIKNAMTISGTYMGGYRTGMLLGDHENGLLDVSAAIDCIKDIPTVAEIMAEFAKGMA